MSLSAIATSGKTAIAELTSAAHEVRGSHAEQRRHRPAPPAAGLVVDIGGGQSVDPRADVVVDKYLVDNFERSGTGELDLSKPVVIADGHELPFADGSFAYVIASHVLEHATDPVRFASELGRVAPAGVVQVPTRASELTFGWSFHPWLIDLDDGVLVFEPRDGRVAPCGELFHQRYQDDALLRLWWASTRSLWHHSVEWGGAPRVRVTGESVAEQTAMFDLERTVAALERAADDGQLQPLTAALFAVLRCPCCRGTLQRGAAGLRCEGCERRYPLAGGVPVLLRAASTGA
jgi:uncharacterized protein YbaR (Trm112 family)